MKKRFFCLCLSCILFLLCACAPAEKTQNPSEDFTPLFRFKVSQDCANKTLLFSLPLSDGFFYFHTTEDDSVLGGFVSSKRSISSESVLKTSSDLSFVRLRETKRDQATILAPSGVSFALLKENGSQTTPLPEGIHFENALFFDDLTLLAETDDLLILCPVDFSQTYVLAQKVRLQDFAKPLAVTHEKSRIWYATKDASGAFDGIAFFEYGKNTPLGRENFFFDSVQPIGNSAVLFTRLLDDKGAVYLFRDLESGSVASLAVDEAFSAVTCDPDAKVLCGVGKGEDSNTVFVYDFQKGKLSTAYETAGDVSQSLAVSSDATELLFSVALGDDEVMGILNLENFL